MKQTIIKFLATTVLAITMTGSALAHTADDALATVKQSVAVVLADLKANKAEYESSPAALNRLINEKMLPYFDAEGMARLVLAKNWHKATSAQRQVIFRNANQQLNDLARFLKVGDLLFH